MKNTIIVIVFLIIGLSIGAILGFLVPFGMAQINPADAPALSFIPMITIPLGAVVGAIVSIILAASKIKRNQLIEDFRANSID